MYYSQYLIYGYVVKSAVSRKKLYYFKSFTISRVFT